MTDEPRPLIYVLRRDLRLGDNPGLTAAAATGRAVIPVFIDDEVLRAQGSAARWRLGQGLQQFSDALAGVGSKLIFRSGKALQAINDLLDETGAGAVWWARAYDPASVERDKVVKSSLKDRGIDAQSHPGHLLFEPWTVETGQGGPYRVYSPYFRAVRGREVGVADTPVTSLKAPEVWPNGEALEDLALGTGMQGGAPVVARFATVGERAARDRLRTFIAEKLLHYAEGRDFPGRNVTSGLSENLTYGEISPRQCWLAGKQALDQGVPGAEKFLSELAWREYAHHLLWHYPTLGTANWRDGWEGFPWRDDNADAECWRQGRTGEPFVDAAMREMFVTGTMHNRARMIVASYLTKHLLTHWKIGLDWFAECLTDWDPASNAMGWQWVAGCGPDAAPYFRIFNPATQRQKFDGDGAYVARWLAEGQRNPHADALAYFDAAPRSWNLRPDDAYPEPIISLPEGRNRALAAYEVLRR